MGLTTNEWNSTLADCGLSRVIKLHSLRNLPIALDALLLIHKAGHASCARDPTLTTLERESILYTRVWDSMYKMLYCLMQSGAVLKCVFDGGTPPAKKATVIARQKNNSSGFKITDSLLKFVISQLSRLGLQVIMAPYEADSQIAWMYWSGQVQYVLTEDSDHHVYGMKCIARLDTTTSSGVLYHLGELPNSFPDKNLLSFYSSIPFRVEAKSASHLTECNPSRRSEDKKDTPFVDAFKSLHAELGPLLGLLLMLFAGNDMVPGGIQGFGIKKTVRLLHSYTDTNILVPSVTNPWESILTLLCEDLQEHLPQARQAVPVQEHFEIMRKILCCFLYAIVCNPHTGIPQTLIPTDLTPELVSWVGATYCKSVTPLLPPPPSPCPIEPSSHVLARQSIPEEVQLPQCPPSVLIHGIPTPTFQCPYVGQRGKECKQRFLCQEEYEKHFGSAHDICHVCWVKNKFKQTSLVRFLNPGSRGDHIRDTHGCSADIKIETASSERTIVFYGIKPVKYDSIIS